MAKHARNGTSKRDRGGSETGAMAVCDFGTTPRLDWNPAPSRYQGAGLCRIRFISFHRCVGGETNETNRRRSHSHEAEVVRLPLLGARYCWSSHSNPSPLKRSICSELVSACCNRLISWGYCVSLEMAKG